MNYIFPKNTLFLASGKKDCTEARYLCTQKCMLNDLKK